MKIRNYNVDEKIAQKLLESKRFLLDVIETQESHHCHPEEFLPIEKNVQSLPHDFIHTVPTFELGNIVSLVHTVPIYLLKNRRKEHEEGIIDLLGAYFSGFGTKSPHIELYVEPILQSVEVDCCTENNCTKSEKFDWLVAKVLIHELMHAALDVYNCEMGRMQEKINYNTPYGKWREESFANAATLYVIKKYGNADFYGFARNYMLTQPAEYALGVKMADALDSQINHYFHWRGREKQYGVCQELQDAWLKYVSFGNIDNHKLQQFEDALTAPQYCLYNGEVYPQNADTIQKIVADYVDAKGSLTFNDLCQVFPNQKSGSKTPFREFPKKQNHEDAVREFDDAQYLTDENQIIHLKDKDIAVCYCWDWSDFSNFIAVAAKNGINVKEKKNK